MLQRCPKEASDSKMKLTKEHLRTLIKEAVEQDRLANLVQFLTSDDLSVVEQGVELAISKTSRKPTL